MSLYRQLGVRASHTQNLFRGLRDHNPTRRGKRPVSPVHTQDTNLGSRSEGQLVRAHPRRVDDEASFRGRYGAFREPNELMRRVWRMNDYRLLHMYHIQTT